MHHFSLSRVRVRVEIRTDVRRPKEVCRERAMYIIYYAPGGTGGWS